MRFEDIEHKTKEASPYEKMARRLRKYVQERLNLTIKASIENWANQFRLLDNDLGGSAQKKIWATLDWLDAQPEQAQLVQISSAKGFRKVYSSFLEPKVAKSEKIDQINISDEAKVIVEKILNMRHWPYPALANLPLAVQECIDNYLPLKIDLKNWLDLNEKTVRPSIAGFVRRIQSRLSCRGFRPVETFCLNWFAAIHHEIEGWRDWSGNFAKYVFRKDGDWTNQLGRSWAYEYDASDKLWVYLINNVWVSK